MKNDLLVKLQSLLDAGDNHGALKLANSWPMLGQHKEAITRGWAALTRRQFYLDIEQDPDALIAAGVTACRALAAAPKAPSVDCGRPHPFQACKCAACRKAAPKRKAVSPLTRGPNA